MNRFLSIAAVGFVAGIIIARLSPISSSLFYPLLLVAGALLLWGWTLGAESNIYTIAIFSAAALFGTADTIHHLDWSSPDHVGYLVEHDGFPPGARIVGRVTAPPDIRERYTIVPFTVDRIELSEDTARTVRRGKLYVKVYPTCGETYSRLTYGADLALVDIYVRKPAPALNPGGFDMRSFLRHQGYFGVVSVRRSDQLEILSTGGGNPLMRMSETIKYRFLDTIKQTLPFPESSFLGGVLLGLRSGLSAKIKDQFRAAGVSHVLAVSGLHVTIITLFFMGMFAIFRVPKPVTFIGITIALILFTLITGARPSTIRAAIMNTVALSFFYFRGMKLDRSFFMGIAVAALVILSMNPLLLGEASFLFSFSAVLSLSLLTRPIWELACRYLRGFFRIFLAIFLFLGALVWLINPRLLGEHWEWSATAVSLLLLGLLLDRLSPFVPAFRKLPGWVTTFTAAQVGIQLGMLPLTALYFKKVSVTAAAANFLAIPLIGVIVQLGLFAGILGQIPVVGPYLALCLNAANWLFIKLFLGSASFFGTRFPYPDVIPPGPLFLTVYYALLMVVATYPHWRFQMAARWAALKRYYRYPAIRNRLILLATAVVVLVLNTAAGSLFKPKTLDIVFLDPRLYGMGGGNAVFIRTPGGFRCLVDAGTRSIMFHGREIPLDSGGKVIVPALLALGHRSLDTVVMTSAKPETAGGLVSVTGNPSLTIGRFCHALPFDSLEGNEDINEILLKLNDPVLMDDRRDEGNLAAWALRDIFRNLRQRNIPVIPVKTGMILHEETIMSGKEKPISLQIEVLNPPARRYAGRYATSRNTIVIRITYGDSGILLTGAADKYLMTRLSRGENLRSAVFQVPAGGAGYGFDPQLLESVKPQIAVLTPPADRWLKRSVKRTAETIRNHDIELFKTDEDGAVMVYLSPGECRVESYASGRQVEL